MHSIDERLFYWIFSSSQEHVWVGSLMTWFTRISAPLFFLILFAYALYFLHRKNYSRIILLITSPVLSFVIVHIIRFLYFRPRPFAQYPIDSLISHEPTASFPSMHAAMAFTIAFAIFTINKKSGAIILVIALMTAFSRVFTGVHFPFDVLFGAFLGGGVVLVLQRVLCPLIFHSQNE